MRIMYITNVRLPTSKAQGYAIMNMCSAFAKSGAEVELVVPDKKHTEDKEDIFEYYNLSPNFKIRKIKSLDLLGRTLHFGRMFYWADTLSFHLAAISKVKINPSDILYTRDFMTTLFFPRHTRIVLELHSIPTRKILFRRAVLKASLFVVLTNHIKERLVTMGVSAEKILVSPSAVDVERFAESDEKVELPGLEPGDFMYGHLGTLKTMNMDKGVTTGLQALTHLPAIFKFLIVGGEDYEVLEYKHIAESLCVSDRAVFTGKMEQSKLSAYAAICSALIAPFPANEHYKYFMSPLKIFEYMAMGVPIVASELPSLREILVSGENALLVPPGDPQALAGALIELKNNPELGRKIAEKAYRDVIEKYTWETRAKNIILFLS